MGALEPRTMDHRIPCAVAFDEAMERGVSPHAVAEEYAQKGTRVGLCQLGLFGYELFGEKRLTGCIRTVPPQVCAALEEAAEDGAVSCVELWSLGDRWGIPRIVLGAAADQIGVRIKNCQLGCFS